MAVWLAFGCGVFIGAMATVFVMALLFAAKQGDIYTEMMKQEKGKRIDRQV